MVAGVQLGLRGRGAQRVAVLAPRPAAVARGGGAEAAALQEDQQLPGVLGAVEGPPVVDRRGAVVALRQGVVLEGDELQQLAGLGAADPLQLVLEKVPSEGL